MLLVKSIYVDETCELFERMFIFVVQPKIVSRSVKSRNHVRNQPTLILMLFSILRTLSVIRNIRSSVSVKVKMHAIGVVNQ